MIIGTGPGTLRRSCSKGRALGLAAMVLAMTLGTAPAAWGDGAPEPAPVHPGATGPADPPTIVATRWPMPDPAPWEQLAAKAAQGVHPSGAVDRGADETPYYFYRGREYGSESLVQPLRLILNGGYGILQLDNRDDRIARIHYRTGVRNVWKNMRDPFAAIQQKGWQDFLEREILPLSANSNKAQYWPNYTQHLIGGGMSYRMYVEWFRYHGWRHPKLMSGGTIAVYHLLNEVVENDDFEGWTTDPIADLYIFDPLSVVLFSHDGVSRFFSETMHMADWSYQPSIDPVTGDLVNNGQNFALKYDLPWSDRWQLFYHFGTHAELGFSRRLNSQDSFSFGAGLRAGRLVQLDDGFRTVDLAASAGVFYDRNNSLLVSLVGARTKEYRMRFNVYPGVLRLGSVAPGFFVADRRTGGFVFGMTMDFLPALPFGIASDFK
jgi:hypothetical protein